MTTMGIPSIVAFEVEVIEPYLKYERRLEKFRRPSKGKSLKVAKLPSFGLSNEGIAIAYPHKNRYSNLHMSQPSRFIGYAWNKGGDGYYHPKAKKEYMDRGPPSGCKLCVEVRH
jgi:hypothetical protein